MKNPIPQSNRRRQCKPCIFQNQTHYKAVHLNIYASKTTQRGVTSVSAAPRWKRQQHNYGFCPQLLAWMRPLWAVNGGFVLGLLQPELSQEARTLGHSMVTRNRPQERSPEQKARENSLFKRRGKGSLVMCVLKGRLDGKRVNLLGLWKGWLMVLAWAAKVQC